MRTNPFHTHFQQDDGVFVGTFSLDGRAHDVYAERVDEDDEDTIITVWGEDSADISAFPLSIMVRAFRRFPSEERFGRALSLYEAFQNGRESL